MVMPTLDKIWNLTYNRFVSSCNARRVRNTLTLEEFKELFLMNCTYCGNESSGLDRMDNTKGYSLANATPCCHSCNAMKRSHRTVKYMFNRIKNKNMPIDEVEG